MGNMVEGFMVGICQTWMTQPEMEGSWIHLKGEAMDMGFILVLVQIGIMVIITIILTRGVRGAT